MADRYTRTESGRAEITGRSHPMPRTARNLLLIIDASKDGDEWVSLVRGCGAADLQTLIDAGLIASLGGPPTPAAAAPAAAPAAAEATVAAPAADEPPAVSALTYSDLYDLLPSLAKEHLGLIKGYRFVLAIEKAGNLAGLQQVAQDLATEVERVKGAAVARAVKRALLLP